MIQSTLQKLIERRHLTEDEAVEMMTRIMDGEATPSQIAGLLTALRMKGEIVDEFTGFARVMRARSVHVPTTRRPLVDTCGTGGDLCKTFNISTAAAFVVAATGVGVAKHGNRSVTSKCGSADVLEALGIRLDLNPAQVGRAIDEVGIGFLFARAHHPAMKQVAGPRQELGIRTVFNALGPLTNPAGARRQLIGVYDPDLCPLLARVLGNLGSEHVLVVHGADGLDEISTLGETTVTELKNGALCTYALTPETLGLATAAPSDIGAGATPDENAALLLGVLEGQPGPRRDIVLANAAAALLVAGVAETLTAGVARAGQLIDDGSARAKLEALRRFTHEAAGA
jgi:anthranilate phosphoribosyltransferase